MTLEVIQLKRGTAKALKESSYVPALAEVVVETDTNKIKIGDGVLTYSALPYWGGIPYVVEDDMISFSPPNDNMIYVMSNGMWVKMQLWASG